MLLQGFFDDSGTHAKSPLLVLGGLIATVEQWKDFSIEWDSKLKVEPTIRYLKMNEAQTMRGEFEHGWTPQLRNQKVFELAEIIPKHVPVRIDCTLESKFFNRYLRGMSYSDVLSDPYFFLLYFLILAIARSHTDLLKGEAEFEYIFDNQGTIGENLMLSWNLMTDAMEPAHRKYMTHVPKFRDDRQCLPLQAADMYAWSVREHQISGNDRNMLSYLVRGQIARAFGIRAFVTEELARELGAHLADIKGPLSGQSNHQLE